MKQNQNEIIDSKIKKVYFMFFCYAYGGGETLVFRIIEYLVKYTNIKVGIIDFTDGILTRTCQKFFPNNNFEYIDYTLDFWKLDDDAVIFTTADRLGCVKPHSGTNIKVSAIVWETGISWRILFEKNKIKKISHLLKKTNAFCFMDYGCYWAVCKSMKQKFTKNYWPIYFQPPKYKISCKKTSEDEINLVWLGRLSEAKLFSIYNILENFYNYQTTKKKKFHIIGNGGCADILKEYCKKYSDEIEFIFTGILTGDRLFTYLQQNTDIAVAMGTSSLNFAALGIPVIAAHEHNKPFRTNEFAWLYDMYEYCSGSAVVKDEISLPMFENLTTFDKMLDDIVVYGKGKEIGQKCKIYFEEKHGNLKNVGDAFLHCIEQTSLTTEMLKNCLKFLPYNGVNGVAINYFKICGLILFKIIHHKNNARLYFGNLCVAKLSRTHESTRFYILGLRVLKTWWWGRYSFPSVTSEKVKKECKNKYSISERIFDD